MSVIIGKRIKRDGEWYKVVHQDPRSRRYTLVPAMTPLRYVPEELL